MTPPVPRLHLVTDRRLCPLDRLPAVVEAAVRHGVDAVHLREKDLPGGQLLALARRLREVTAGRAQLLVNERVDVALLAAADGVQLGEQAIPVADARRLTGQGMLIGRSVHDVAGARRAVAGGADFLIAGTVYATPSKPEARRRGTEFVAEMTAAVPVPVIAIGGITPERVREVTRAGARGVAVISGILAAADPGRAAAAYRAALEGGVDDADAG